MVFRFADHMREALILVFDAYAKATGDAMTAISARFAGDLSFYGRLPANRPSARTVDTVLQRFSDAWPENAAWPENVPKPPKGKWDDLKAPIIRPGGKARSTSAARPLRGATVKQSARKGNP